VPAPDISFASEAEHIRGTRRRCGLHAEENARKRGLHSVEKAGNSVRAETCRRRQQRVIAEAFRHLKIEYEINAGQPAPPLVGGWRLK
jgi:hypothetical protein